MLNFRGKAILLMEIEGRTASRLGSDLLVAEMKPICGVSRGVREIPYVERPCDRVESPRIIPSISHILTELRPFWSLPPSFLPSISHAQAVLIRGKRRSRNHQRPSLPGPLPLAAWHGLALQSPSLPLRNSGNVLRAFLA